MKTIVMLIVSSLFLSTISNSEEKDSIDKIMIYKIENAEKIKVESTISSRTPIIIVKTD